jgi:aminoglycoside 6'-N-acetyltransferase I
MTGMDLVDLGTSPEPVREQAATLLVDGFHEPHGWPNLAAAREEVAIVIRHGFARAVLENGALAGWIGGIPNPGYDGRVWELHPIVVRQDYRRQGIGRALVGAFEAEARRRGAITVTLGTDDHTFMTSLGGVDLYGDIPRHIAELRDLGRGHPFLFYRKLGYVVTGVMPDANGPGKPDIYMSKSLRR